MSNLTSLFHCCCVCGCLCSHVFAWYIILCIVPLFPCFVCLFWYIFLWLGPFPMCLCLCFDILSCASVLLFLLGVDIVFCALFLLSCGFVFVMADYSVHCASCPLCLCLFWHIILCIVHLSRVVVFGLAYYSVRCASCQVLLCLLCQIILCIVHI